MFVPTKVKIIILPSHTNQQGLAPVFLRFTQQRKVNTISLRKYVPPADWIDTGQLYVKERGGSIANPKELNSFLRTQIARAEKILLEAEQVGQPLTFQQFKKKFINTEVKDFILFCEQEIQRRDNSGNYSKETIRSNWFKLNKLKTFRNPINFFELTTEFLADYERYLRVERENGINTIFTALKFIRTMLNAARKMKLTEVYPFENYPLKYKKDTRERLDIEEINTLQQLYDSKTLSDSRKAVLRLFLFSTYTGLAWGDLVTLKYENIKRKGNYAVIHKKRSKTGVEFIVPLIEQARLLVDLRESTGKVFPKIMSNQKANAYIKEIIKLTNITKHVTFHVSRHSFATIAINQGIPKEVIKRILGHAKDSSVTDLYAKIQDNYIIKEMRKLDAGLSDSSFREHFDEPILKEYKKLRIQLISARIAEGHSELDAAQVIGVSEQEYKEMEKGEAQIGLAHWVALRRWLGVG